MASDDRKTNFLARPPPAWPSMGEGHPMQTSTETEPFPARLRCGQLLPQTAESRSGPTPAVGGHTRAMR